MYSKSEILTRLDTLYRLNSKLTDYFQMQLGFGTDYDDLHQYLDKRGFTKEILDLFRIGYCPDAQVIYDFLISQGYTDQDVEDVGFWKVLDNNDVAIKFEKRLMFPYSDIDDSIYGFSGRKLEDSTDDSKYTNTSNSKTYNKSLVIYGLREAFICNPKIQEWILVEGNIDVTSMFKIGYTNTVSCGGTAVTKYHILRLAQYCDNFTILFDNDDAGKKASIKLNQMLMDLHFNAKICILDSVKDADEAIRNGKEELIHQLFR